MLWSLYPALSISICMKGGLSVRPASFVNMGSAFVGSRPYTLSCSRRLSRSAVVNVVSSTSKPSVQVPLRWGSRDITCKSDVSLSSSLVTSSNFAANAVSKIALWSHRMTAHQAQSDRQRMWMSSKLKKTCSRFGSSCRQKRKKYVRCAALARPGFWQFGLTIQLEA